MGTTPSRAQAVRFGPFTVVADQPNQAFLNGEIAPNAADAFSELLVRFPTVDSLILDSPGGNLGSAIAIAVWVHELNLATHIPAGSSCYSACSFIFFAGGRRTVDGELGVHQFTSEDPNEYVTQAIAAIIVEMLDVFEVSPEVRFLVLTVPPNELHVFSPREIADYGIERGVRVVTPPGLDVPPAALVDRLLFSYTARLGPADHYNSGGVRLESPWQIIQQDRANYHRFGVRDEGDEGDPLFVSVESRNLIPALLAAGVAYSGLDMDSTLERLIDTAPIVVIGVFERGQGGFYLIICDVLAAERCGG